MANEFIARKGLISVSDTQLTGSLIVSASQGSGVDLYVSGSATKPRVGIGIETPAKALTVLGDISASGNIEVDGGITGSAITGSFKGDGAGITGLSSAAVSSYTNSTNNRVITSVDSSTINSEANLTFDGSNLAVLAGNVNVATGGKLGILGGVAWVPTTSGTYMNLEGSAKLMVNETANANMSIGLTINQATSDDEILAFKSSDVAHGRVGYAETDTFFSIKKGSAAYGGVTLRALAEDAAMTTPLTFVAHGGTANTTKSAAGRALIELIAVEHDGSDSDVNTTADGNVLGVSTRVGGDTYMRWLVDEDGDTWQAGNVDLDAGAVINFHAGDVTITHSANTLTVAGASTTVLNGTVSVGNNFSVAGDVTAVWKVTNTTQSTSLTSGAIQTAGGLGVAKDVFIGGDFTLLSDAGVLGFGADTDVTLTHVADTGLLLNSTRQLQFNDSSQYISGTSATVLSIAATDEIDLTATAIDINGTVNISGATVLATSLTLATGATVTGIDNGSLGSSATLLATQGAVKTYVDAQVTAQDLDITTDSGTIDIDLDSETLTIAGGTGLASSASSTTVTLAIDSTVATLTGSQTLTNKTITSPDINAGTADGLTSLTVGTDGSGADVYFYSATSGDHLFWDASEELLTITGTNGQTALNVADGNVTVADTLTATNIGAFTATGAIDFGSQNMTNVDVDSGTIDGATVGAASATTGAFTTLAASSTLAVTGVSTLSDDVRMAAGKKLYLGGEDTSPFMTQGITINSAGADNMVMRFNDTVDVAHGCTTAPIAPLASSQTDDWAIFQKNRAEGGLLIAGLQEDGGSEPSIRFEGYGGQADTNKSASARALFEFWAYEHDGANALTAVTADGNVFAIRVYDGTPGAMRTRWMVDEDGDTWQYGAIKLENNSGQILMKDAGGNHRDVLYVSAGDDVQFGSTSLDNMYFNVGSRSGAMVISETTGNVTIDPGGIAVTGVATMSDDIDLAYQKGLYLDGGGDTYISSPSTDTVRFTVGDTTLLQMGEHGGGANDYVQIPAAARFYLDGGNHTHFSQVSADLVRFVVGGNTVLDIGEGGGGLNDYIAIQAANRFYLDGVDNTYLSEASADVISLTAGGTATLNINDAGVGIGTTAPNSGSVLELKKTAVGATTDFVQKHVLVTTGFGGGYDNKMVSLLSGRDGTTINAVEIGYAYTGSGYALGFATNDNTSGEVIERMRIDKDGNVGIGTSSPSALLEVSKTSGAEIKVFCDGGVAQLTMDAGGGSSADAVLSFKDDGTEKWKIFYDATTAGGTEALYFQDDGDIRMTLTQAGRVGIGTTAPGSALHVQGSSSQTLHLESTGNDQGVLILDGDRADADSTCGQVRWQWNNNRVAQIAGHTGADTANKDDGELGFYTAASSAGGAEERMRIDSAGNVGIGETDPDTLLHVKGGAVRAAESGMTAVLEGSVGSSGAAGLNILSTSTGTIGFGDAGNPAVGKITYAHGDDSMSFGTADSTKMSISSAGLVTVTGTARINGQVGLNMGTTTSMLSMYIATAGAYAETINHASSNPLGILVDYSAHSPNGTGNYFFAGTDSTTTRVALTSDGGIYNYSGNNVNLSDERLKIIHNSTTSKWDAHASLEIFDYNYTDSPDTRVLIGVGASQAGECDDRLCAHDGWDTGAGTYHGLYSTDLSFYTMKTVQECQARIEALEAKIAALEAA